MHCYHKLFLKRGKLELGKNTTQAKDKSLLWLVYLVLPIFWWPPTNRSKGSSYFTKLCLHYCEGVLLSVAYIMEGFCWKIFLCSPIQQLYIVNILIQEAFHYVYVIFKQASNNILSISSKPGLNIFHWLMFFNFYFKTMFFIIIIKTVVIR